MLKIQTYPLKMIKNVDNVDKFEGYSLIFNKVFIHIKIYFSLL